MEEMMNEMKNYENEEVEIIEMEPMEDEGSNGILGKILAGVAIVGGSALALYFTKDKREAKKRAKYAKWLEEHPEEPEVHDETTSEEVVDVQSNDISEEE